MMQNFRSNQKRLLIIAMLLGLVTLLATGVVSSAGASPFGLVIPPAQALLAATVPNQQSNCSGAPVISSFAVSPSTIQPGQTATLSWGPVTNAQAAYLFTPGQVTGVGTPGQMAVQPDQTATYMIQAVCDTFTSQSLVTVEVGVPSCGSGPPTISSFVANPSIIQPGQTSTLQWGLVANAQSAVLVTPQGKQGVGTPGQQVVQPGQTTTYTLLGYCGNDTVGQSVTVTVAGTQGCQGTPSIQYFTANPQVIQPGQESTLQWGLVSNASGAYLGTPDGIQGIGTPGQTTVKPNATSNYTLYATCGSTTIQANTTVYVQ